MKWIGRSLYTAKGKLTAQLKVDEPTDGLLGGLYAVHEEAKGTCVRIRAFLISDFPYYILLAFRTSTNPGARVPGSSQLPQVPPPEVIPGRLRTGCALQVGYFV